MKLNMPLCFCCMFGSPGGEIASIFPAWLWDFTKKVFAFYQEAKSHSERLTCNSRLGCSLKFA